MFWRFKSKDEFAGQLIFGIIILIGFAFSPMLISMFGAFIIEAITGEPCHEGNCIFGVIGWLFLITIPLALFLLLLYIIIAASEYRRLTKIEKK